MYNQKKLDMKRKEEEKRKGGAEEEKRCDNVNKVSFSSKKRVPSSSSYTTTLAASFILSQKKAKKLGEGFDTNKNVLVCLSKALRISILLFVGSFEVLKSLVSVSREMREVIRNDECLWKIYTQDLWIDKVHVPPQIRRLHENGKSRLAFRKSFLESRRAWISLAELQSFDWAFRMRKCAPDAWSKGDPYWDSAREDPTKVPPSLVVHFNPNGIAERKDMFEFSRGADGKWEYEFMEHGAIIKISNFPEYNVIRLPNWGFVLLNMWTVLSSVPFPAPVDSYLSDDTLNTISERQKAEVEKFTQFVMSSHFNVGSSDEEQFDDFSNESGIASNPVTQDIYSMPLDRVVELEQRMPNSTAKTNSLRKLNYYTGGGQMGHGHWGSYWM